MLIHMDDTFGPGRVSIDHLLAARRRAKEPVGRHVRVEERVRVLS